MALFSDIDWTILLAVAGFLVLGKDGGRVLRQLGRMYGRMTRVKQELLTEFSKAADIPAPIPGRPVSVRQSLLHWELGEGRTSGIPAAVVAPPVVVLRSEGTALAASVGLGASTWSVAIPGPRVEREGSR